MKLRTPIFWMHLTAGVLAGVVILVMCVTGVLLGYERQINDWSLRGYRFPPPAQDAPRLPPSVLLSKAREAEPGASPSNLILFSDGQAPAAVRFGRDRTLYVNPYTGAALGEGSKKLQSFFASVENVHRWLGATGDHRAAARTVTGVCNLCFFFLVASGPFLWWPRSWNLTAVRNVIFFKPGLKGKARDFNWHNTIGVWCAFPLFIVVACAVVMSFPWANNLVYRLTGSPVPPPAVAPDTQGADRPRTELPGRRQGVPPARAGDNFDALWARAEQQVPGWQSISLQVPITRRTAAFTIDQSNGSRPDKRATLTLDPKTTEVESWMPFSSNSPGRQLRTWIRWTHTGEAGGLIGQTIAVVASAGGIFLVWTGLALMLRRFSGWVVGRFKGGRRPETVVAESVTGVESVTSDPSLPASEIDAWQPMHGPQS